jgi:hypothetical protein
MDRKLKSFSTSSNSASSPRALKSVIAVAMAAGLIGCALPAAVSTPGAASTAQHAVSVNRINKGDRLSREVTLKRTPAVSSPVVSVAGRPRDPDPCLAAVRRTARLSIPWTGSGARPPPRASSRVLLPKKGTYPWRCRRGRTDPVGRSNNRHQVAIAAGCLQILRCSSIPNSARPAPPASGATAHRARRRHAAPRQLLSRCPHAERGHLRKGPGELAGTVSLCSRCPPRTTPRALAACSAALVRSPIRRRSFSARAA